MKLRSLLACLALVFLPSRVALAQSDEMTFRLVTPPNCGRACPVYVLGSGRITLDSPRQFQALAASLPSRRLPVYLTSQGGSLVGGIRLGLALREYGATVSVPSGAVCASACTYAFLGGVVRGVPQGARLGVHRFFARDADLAQRPVPPDLELQATALLTHYVAAMGAHPALVNLAARVDHRTIHFLSPTELRRYGVVTQGKPRGRPVASRARHGKRRAAVG